VRRRLFTLTAFLSLLLCVATVALCVWSNKEGRNFMDYTVNRNRLIHTVRSVVIYDGQICFVSESSEFDSQKDSTDYLSQMRQGYSTASRLQDRDGGFTARLAWHGPTPRKLGTFGFQWQHTPPEKRMIRLILIHPNPPPAPPDLEDITVARTHRSRTVAFPIWLVVVCLAILPIWCARDVSREWKVRKRVRQGRCAVCSYDLTASTSRVCPECGTAIKSKDVPIKIG
jgi:hypothetical protein